MRRPLKGTVVQHWPAFYLSNMAGSSFGVGPVALGDIIAVGLQNTADDGSWLVIWDVQVFTRPSGAASVLVVDFAIMGGRTGSFFADEPTNPLTSRAGKLPGVVWA